MTGIIFPLMTFTASITIPFSSFIPNKIGYKNACLIECFLMSFSIWFSSFMPNFWLFTMFYCIIFGLISGLLQLLPIFMNCRNFPKDKGTVTGDYFLNLIIIYYFFILHKTRNLIKTGIPKCGIGISTLISGQIVFYIINPSNIKPIK